MSGGTWLEMLFQDVPDRSEHLVRYYERVDHDKRAV